MLIVFDDIVADMRSNKKYNPIVTDLLIRGVKLKVSLVFITQPYFSVPKNIRLNSIYYFIMKFPNKRQLQQIVMNHSYDIDDRDFIKLYKKYTAEPYSFQSKRQLCRQIIFYDLDSISLKAYKT